MYLMEVSPTVWKLESVKILFNCLKNVETRIKEISEAMKATENQQEIIKLSENQMLNLVDKYS